MSKVRELPGGGSIKKSEKMIDIGTHRLRVVLSESQSETTIVLEAGGGEDSASYQKIQDDLAKLTGMRVMSYDRSGFGQSEYGPEHFNAVDEVEALRKCLEVQGFTGKYLLVGLSYGGYLAQLFACRHPELVSGLVLLDPMNICFVDRFGLDNLNAATPYITDPITDKDKALNRMVDASRETFAAMRGKTLPPEIPVVLITAGNPPFSKDLWRRCHQETILNAKDHKMIVAEQNNHNILAENPELVLKTIVELADHLRP